MCTRAFWSANSVAKIAARTMDWQVSDEPKLWRFGSGLTRDGGVMTNAYRWRSRYASVQVSGWDEGYTDGLNNQGLGVHLLYLEDTNYEPTDERPAVSNLRVVQLLLDLCATVTEAVDLLRAVRMESVEIRQQNLGIHLAIEDPSGDSAVVEVVGGQLVVHHGAEYAVLANDPTFDEQLANVKRYRPFGGELAPPGDILSDQRFVRACYFLHYLPEPTTYQETLASIAMVGRNVSVPPGAPYEDFAVYPTWWLSLVDVTNRTYYFQPSSSPNLIWVELDSFDPHAGQCDVLDPADPALSGEVSDLFAAATPIA